MSYRREINDALVNLLKTIKIANGFQVDLFENVSSQLLLWDEVNDFPTVIVTSGNETREYHPAGFKWGFVGYTLRIYTYGESGQLDQDLILQDIENLLDKNNRLSLATTGRETTEITVNSIVTDEGLLMPYSVAEMNITVRYQSDNNIL
jgi:hypothetical protein